MSRFKRLSVLLGLIALVGVASAVATPGSGVSVTELGRARIAEPFTIETKGPSDLIFIHGRVDPGGDTGWHSHPAPEIAIVKAGTLTYYDANDKDCTPHAIAAGQGHFESPGRIHITRNEGSVPVEVYAAFVVPAEVQAPLRSASDCPF